MLLTEENINDNEICTYESAQITKSIYNQSLNNLIIYFKGGNVFSYTPIDYIMYLEFKEAESQTKFFNSNIKKNENILAEGLNK